MGMLALSSALSPVPALPAAPIAKPAAPGAAVVKSLASFLAVGSLYWHDVELPPSNPDSDVFSNFNHWPA